MTSLRLPLLLLACLAAASSMWAAPASAQERAAPPPVPERVYVPIERFDEVFAKEGRGVFVPWDELRALVARARAATEGRPAAEPPAPAPPADALLVSAAFAGRAADGVAHFTATFAVEVLEPREWVVVPIGLGEASLEDVRTGDGSGAVVAPLADLAARLGERGKDLPRRGYGILLRGAGRVETTARFAVPVAAKPGESSFALSLPGAPLTQFEVTLPETGFSVDVAGALATEEAPDADAGETRVRAYFGGAGEARVTWNPKPKEVEGAARDPLLFASTTTGLRIDEGLLQVGVQVSYQILQAPCGEFRLRIPAGYTLLGVEGEHIADVPPPVPHEGGQLVVVRLHERAAGRYALTLRLERNLAEGEQAFAFPQVLTLGTERESGLLAARASEFISLEPAGLRGLSQVDVGSLTPALAKELGWSAQAGGDRPPLVFRYLRQPYALRVETAPVLPEVDGVVSTLAAIHDDKVDLSTTVTYEVRKRGIFDVRLRLPQGFVLDGPITPQVKQHRVEPATAEERQRGLGDVLAIDFLRQVQPGASCAVSFRGYVLRTPAQPDEGEATVALPRVGLIDVEEETGLIGVAAQGHLELSLPRAELRGLFEEPPVRLRALGFRHRPATREVLTHGLRYSAPEGVAATFTVKKRKPKVSARVDSLVDAQEDKVRVEATVRYTVEHAGIDRLRLRVPAALASEEALRITGDGMKDKQVAVEGEHATWTVSLQDKRLGEYELHLQYDVKLEDFQAGQQRAVTLHEVEVVDAFTETGDYALKKHENLVIGELEMVAVEKRDKRELSEALKRQGPLQAYHYASHPHKLTLQLTKYDFQAPLGIVVRHLHQDEVLTGDGALKAEAFLSLQNNAEQFLTVLLPKGAVMRGLKVDGKNEEWSEGQPDAEGRPSVQVHLGEVTKVRKEEPFLLRIRYDLPGEPLGSKASLPLYTLRFPLAGDKEVPVARLTRTLHLPDELNPLELDTDATKHFDETSLWEGLKRALGVRTGRERLRPEQARAAAAAAITALKQTPVSASEGGIYPDLEVPAGRQAFTFEKLENPSRLTVTAMRWSLFYLLDLLVFLAVVGAGVGLERARVAGPAAYVSVAAGLAVLGGAFLGRSLEPFCASALAGSVGLGVFFFGRGVWRELTTLRHERRLAALAEEAEVARERARAAEQAARARGAAAPAPAPADPKAAGKDGEGADAAEAERIQFDEGPSGSTPPGDA